MGEAGTGPWRTTNKALQARLPARWVCGRAGVAFGTVAPLELELSVGLAEQEVAPVQAHDAVL